MKVLVIGGGGREHALAWKIKKSDLVEELYTAPGNAGTAMIGTNIPLGADDIKNLASFAEEEKMGLTVVGPENPLAHGIVDEFNVRGLRIFGPTKIAAQLEASKAFAKTLMDYHDIPTSEFEIFDDYTQASLFLKRHWREHKKWVPKGSGLAGGKAALVCDTLEEADNALYRLMVEKEFGSAGNFVVLEERLYGEEVSHIGFANGTTFIPFPPTQDYKPIYDGNRGPNTGGMGGYSPRRIDTSLLREVDKQIMISTLHAMGLFGSHYSGALYGGLMLTDEGPKVLEFNCRFGDPETQPTVVRMKSDIVPYLEACIDGSLGEMPPIEWDPRYSVCLVLASGGYPGKYERGELISGLDYVEGMEDVTVFHAGTILQNGGVYTNGGRVLGVTALGDTLEQARQLAYEAAERTHFDNMYYRNDIAVVK